MLGSSNGSREMLLYARSLGASVVVTDNLPPEKSVCKPLADEVWDISTADVDALEARARQAGITAVSCGVSEFNTGIMIELCSRLGLPTYLSADSWRFSRDKSLFKSLATDCGLLVPEDLDFSALPGPETPDMSAHPSMQALPFPVVVKAVDLWAGEGLSYCSTPEEVRKGIEKVHRLSSSDKVIVERRIFGREYVPIYVAKDGESRLLALTEFRHDDPSLPPNCYTSQTTDVPAEVITRWLTDCDAKIRALLKKIGVREGCVWFEAILAPDGFHFLEMAQRPPGPMIGPKLAELPELRGYNIHNILIDLALGLPTPPLPPTQTSPFSSIASTHTSWLNGTPTVIYRNLP